MKYSFVLIVIIAMALGLITGVAVHAMASPEGVQQAASGFSQVTTVFLRLIKMIIAPLVLTTLTAGIGRIEGTASVGRIGAKAMTWFLIASLVALLIGFVMVNLLEPGVGVGIRAASNPVASVQPVPQGMKEFLEHLIPSSIAEAMAKNEILQIVVFSVFAGTAISAVGEKASALLGIIEQMATVILKMTCYVMMFAPIAIFAAIANAIATQGAGILASYAKLIIDYYISLSFLILLMVLVAWRVLGAQIKPLLLGIRSPALIAFSMSASEPAFPLLLETLERMGYSSKIVSFVLPLGYSFNLVGAAMYCAFATLFIAQAYGIHLSTGQQALMLLMLMVTSKGIATVPRASLVVVAATLPYFNLPEQGLSLILAVDHFMDMGRSATNVIGNGLASAVVAKWEMRRSFLGQSAT